MNRLLYAMATDDEYLRPLSIFRRRVAYANAFGTDLVVPVGTAAFFCHDGGAVHTAENPPADLPGASMLAGIFRTEVSYAGAAQRHRREDDLAEMSEKLDSLGWTKKFFDVRGVLPSIPGPLRSGLGGASAAAPPHRAFRSGDRLRSGELLDIFSSGNGTVLPAGHNMIVANSKNGFHAAMNRGGRPIMDHLAVELVSNLLETTKTPVLVKT